MSEVAKTGFYASTISYIVFLLADYVRPGFVSNVFSVHWFLLAIVVFGTVWSINGREADDHDGYIVRLVSGSLFKGFVSIVLFIVFWKEGEAFGDMRGFLAISAALLPWIALIMLKSVQESEK